MKDVWDYLEDSPAAGRLAAQVAAGRVAHAWLLLGPAGSGKRPAALAIACALNCDVRPGSGCGTCHACERILRQRHPDVHHVVSEGPLIPVDVIRETVVPEAARSPFEGRTKVFVIEEADRMNAHAQNSLLKTLEEPEIDTVFVLITDHEEELLETIRSRCRIVRLEPVSEQRIVELLRKHGTSEDDAVLAARLSRGNFERARAYAFDPEVSERRAAWVEIPSRLSSPRDALDIAADVVDRTRTAMKSHEAAQKEEIARLAEVLGEGRGTGAARTALAKRHKRELKRLEESVVGEALHALSSFYRDVVVLRSAGADTVTNVDLLDDLQGWASSSISDAALLQAAERVVQARASFTRNANLVLAVEAALVAVARLTRSS